MFFLNVYFIPLHIFKKFVICKLSPKHFPMCENNFTVFYKISVSPETSCTFDGKEEVGNSAE